MKYLKTYKIFEDYDFFEDDFDDDFEDEDKEDMYYPKPEKEDDMIFNDDKDTNNGYVMTNIELSHNKNTGRIYYTFTFSIPYDMNWDEAPSETQIEGYVDYDDWLEHDTWTGNLIYYDMNRQEHKEFIYWMDDILIEKIQNFMRDKKVKDFNL